jgi:hypothetical protein
MGFDILAFLLGGLMAAASPSSSSDESIEVKVRGTLHAGMMAIGGETTGYTISARGVTWELDFGSREELRRKAQGLDGKAVIVTGTLEVKPGVEIASRSIVKVDTLAPAGSTGPSK